jgi:alkaline phosphatase D
MRSEELRGGTSVNPGRREFIKRVSAAGAAVAASTGLSGCFAGDIDFLHGVASGDPLADRVMLWTRVTPSPEWFGNLAKAEAEVRKSPHLADKLEELKRIVVRWEVSRDADFKRRVRVGVAVTSADRDFTVKVDVDGLRSATTYYYRFTAAGSESATGRTRTLPALLADAQATVKLAVFSCANYPAGYFNAYAAAAQIDDLDALIHLGDYIYEYPRNGYASDRAAELGRLSEPDAELITLAQYRTRHAQYRSDPDLQVLTGKVPLIAVWDDHELANNAWRQGAENHTPAAEGPWEARRAAAIRAYYEWLPIREVQPGRSERIFRSFDFGTLISLHMLDTRVIGRDLQLDYANFITPARFNAAGFAAAVGDPARQLLGAEQTVWLQNQMARSTATWQVLGQQVLMGRMNVPAPILFQQISVSGYAALAQKAATAPQSLTPQELAILQAPSIPYNLDAWDGYAVARETVLGTARQLNKNLVVVAGDTHNAWANDLADLSGAAVGVEFATASVSSPGFESIFPSEDPTTFARSLETLIGPLVYTDTSRRGFLLLTATHAECRAEWQFVDTVFSRQYRASVGRTLRTLPGAGNRKIQDVEPS